MIRSESRPSAAEVALRRTSQQVAWLVAALLLVVFAVGCGRRSKLERVLVSGKASYAGQPIEIGQIRFVPFESTRAPITVENIRNGTYNTDSSGGVPVGTHRVEIRMFDSEEYKNAPRVPGSPGLKQLLPAKYNRDSELTFEIPSGSGSIAHDYTLEK
jgi:hypothetical protein